MNKPDSWNRTRELFEQARQRGPEDRTNFLQQECGDDAELLAEVQSLLDAFEPAKEELESSPVRLVDDDPPSTVPEDAIPGYQILEEIHRGGQGVVYLALQHGTKRQVALKLILEGPFASLENKRRFEREVELVGSLQHPNIVPIYESGTAHGHHYYAMKYVRGLRLDAYVRDGDLTADATLRLFVKVTAAVGYAHQNGVIHRDLKPSNVLVDGSGEPHVLDFGLAKFGGVDIDARQESWTGTMTGHIMGTLSYMSPEQAAGRPGEVDLRSDVYALGVVLYELLCEHLPYDLDNTLIDNLGSIQTAEPKPMAACGRRFSNEVETIILKAISKEKTRRYPTAGAFGEDISRFLSGDAIEAKRDSALYVLRKA